MKLKRKIIGRGLGLSLLLLVLWVGIVSAALVDNRDGTISDTETGLMWQQAETRLMNWQEALAYCENLVLPAVGGYDDWRLPDRYELQSLVDYSSDYTCLDQTFFPEVMLSYYWTSTTYALYTRFAWLVFFGNGIVYYNDKSYSFYVRAVRAGQSGPVTLDNMLYFPHIASNATWETEICAINTSDTQTISGAFKAYDNAGVLVSGIDVVDLAPHGRTEITVGDEFSDPADIGYVVFESDSSAVVGYTKFYKEGQYRVAVPAVPDSEINTGDIYLSHIASGGSAQQPWYTGVSLLNTTSSPKTLTIEFDNDETKTVELLANEHKAFTIRSLFDGQQPQPDIHSAVVKDASGVIGLELFTNNARKQMSGILLKDDTTTSIYYPHTASENGWSTGIVAYNPSDTPCDMTITPYTAAGDALTTMDVPIGGKEKYIGVVSALGLPADTAWFQIDATSPITGFELFTKTNQLGGYTGVGISGTEGVFAKLEKDGYTGIAFVNIENSSATVTLTAYDDIGTEIATEVITLDAHEKVVSSVEGIFTEDISSATYITYSSDNDVVGFQLNISSDGMMLDGLPGM